MSASTEISVAVVIPVRRAVPAVGGLEAIAEAHDVAGKGARCRVVLVGDGTEDVARIVRSAGFTTSAVVLCESPTFQPARIAEALADLVDEDIVILPSSNDGRDLAPRLAARLGRPLLAGAQRVTNRRAELVTAGGQALADVDISGPVVVTFQPGARALDIAPTPQTGRAGAVTQVPAFAAFARSSDVEVTGISPPDVATMDLAEAPFILGAGAGLQSENAMRTLDGVARRLGAAVGATRVVTDAGWVGHDRQIGTTGVVVDPEVYVAFGVSGAVQHVSGLGTPAHIISVNTDPHCPMAARAELAVVADAPAVVVELARQLADDDRTAPQKARTDD